jgi:peptide/nickel transport system permease protein
MSAESALPLPAPVFTTARAAIPEALHQVFIPAESAAPAAPAAPAGTRRRFSLRRFNPGLFLAALFAAILVIAAIAPRALVSADPLEANARDAFRAPSAAHPLGTDENGRDVLARLVHGVRPSIVMGLAATAIGLTLGVGLGLFAGLSHRLLDGLAMRFIDVLLAFPDILLALVIITFWGQGTLNAIIAVGVASVPRYARLVRAQTHVVRNAPYVEAAVTLGLHKVVLIVRHVLPNTIKPVLILAIIGIGGKIGAGAALSFLGLGSPPPAPEWGSMLSVGRNFLSNAWWLTAVPAAAITLTVISLTTLGRALLRRSEGKSA